MAARDEVGVRGSEAFVGGDGGAVTTGVNGHADNKRLKVDKRMDRPAILFFIVASCQLCIMTSFVC